MTNPEAGRGCARWMPPTRYRRRRQRRFATFGALAESRQAHQPGHRIESILILDADCPKHHLSQPRHHFGHPQASIQLAVVRPAYDGVVGADCACGPVSDVESFVGAVGRVN